MTIACNVHSPALRYSGGLEWGRSPSGLLVPGNLGLSVPGQSGLARPRTVGQKTAWRRLAWRALELLTRQGMLAITNPVILTEGGSGTDAASYDTASITPSANKLVFIAQENEIGSGTPNQATITGNGITWNLILTLVYDVSGTQYRVTWAWGTAASPSTGVVNFDFAAQTQAGCGWFIWEVDGAHLTSPIVQTATGTGASTTPLATLGALTAGNATFGVEAHENATEATAGTNFTLIGATNHASPSTSLSAEWNSNNDDTTVDWTITSAIWGALAAEVQPAAAAGHPAMRRWALVNFLRQLEIGRSGGKVF